ncbi:MAG: ATP-dependent DNA ligase [Propionibacteriaceae bacterium]
MELSRIADATVALAATRSRLAKRAIIAAVVRDTTVDDVEVTVSYLSGSLRQRRTGIGWRSMVELPPPAAEPTLTVTEVDDAMSAAAELTGAGSAGRRTAVVQQLFGRATVVEQSLLRGLVVGELRQGALEAQVQDGIAAAYEVDAAVVRRAAMLLGSTSDMTLLLLTGGEAALRAVQLRVGIAVQPMLAASAPDVAAALIRSGGTKRPGDPGPRVVDVKLDGIRLQVHKQGERVWLFTRSLDDVTSRMPEIVAAVAALPYHQLVIDGEALLVRPDGRPEPFQVIASRTATREIGQPGDDEGGQLSLFAFDLLRVEDTDLLDVPLRERVSMMESVLPDRFRVDRLMTADPDAANAFFLDAVAQGYEGVVIKNPAAPYAAGRRDSGWVKVKPRHTFDLVVLAAEWGHGRRAGWLSNLHLGARSDGGPSDGDAGWVMLGKTFKGLTDELLEWQTRELLAREVRRTPGAVIVEPTLVVEIACDGLQRSTRYPGGVALRFARVLRYRDDKSAAEADTIDTVTSLLQVTD